MSEEKQHSWSVGDLETYRAPIYALCRRSGVPSEDAEDITQIVLLKVHRSLEGFRGEAQIRTWVYRIATNALIDYRKWRQRQPLTEVFGHSDAGAKEDDRETFQQIWESQTPADPIQQVLNEEQNHRIREALQHLTEHQRVIISLRLQEKSFSEIAEVTGMSSVAVRMTASRSYAVLRKHLVGV